MKFHCLMISSLLSSIVVVGLASTTAQAETLRTNLRHSYKTEVNRNFGSGRSLNRSTQQTVAQNQFQRQTVVTTAQGNQASRSVAGGYDADTQSYSRNLAGTRLNGDSYAASRETVKTDAGYARNLSRTNAAGATATVSTAKVRDKATKSITKDVQATGFSGKGYSATVTRSYGASGS